MVPGITVLLRLLDLKKIFFGQNTLSLHPQNGGNFANGVSITIPRLHSVCLIGAISEMY